MKGRRAVALFDEPTIGAMWSTYRAKVLEPSGVPGNGVQMREMRRTFYTACNGLLGMLHQLPDHMSEDQACEALEAMSGECRVFMDKVLAGEPGF